MLPSGPGGETSKHVDCLEWEKGREVSFNSASLFFTKVASGNVGVMRSRDLKFLHFDLFQLFNTALARGAEVDLPMSCRSSKAASRTGSLNIADSFSFYFASVGFYLYNVVTDLSMRTYVNWLSVKCMNLLARAPATLSWFDQS